MGKKYQAIRPNKYNQQFYEDRLRFESSDASITAKADRAKSAYKNSQQPLLIGTAYGLSYNILQRQFMSDADRLIEFHAEQEDRQLCEQYECLQVCPTSASIESSVPVQVEDMYQEMDSPSQPISEQQVPKVPVKESSGHEIENRGLIPAKRKLIQKSHINDSDSLQSFSKTDSTIRRRKVKRGKDEKPYPTKNFLQNFKGPHLDFLRKFLKMSLSEFYSIPFLKYLKEKNGISLEDYQKLYSFEEFSDAFEAMFASKYLYRELVLSRSHVETKKIHQRKVAVFEKAFRTKVFTKIN